ncbi:hypothetical protein [Salinarchaeum laminariae]|uniref:hypothetical protein n=1 Tax=Salinarchaeum laminariae TaxID=869888 RepID=UPI0020C14CCB|nr:hypothetical protein [Salinarchaeum laminariae]
MGKGGEPTESYDGSITVRILDDETGKRLERCSSFVEAIEIVKENQYTHVETKIVDRDGDVVFSSVDHDIDTWESIWKQEKLRQGVDVEEYDCPYDNISCFADDLCVQCKMDKVQDDIRQVE